MVLSKKEYALKEAKWLTEISSDWRSFRLKEVAKVSPSCSDNGPKLGEACSVIPMEVITEKGTFNDYDIEDYEIITSGLTNFENGDVIFAKITPCMENGKGAFVEKLKTKYAFGSTEFHVFRPKSLVDGKFLYYYTYDPEYRKYAAENMTGAAGQKRVSTRFIEYTPVFLPDVSEQKRISAYLDRQCAAIDKVLEIKKEQLTILDDLRKSVIHNAVTKGPDDSTELVDSGIEWMGKIPKEWKIDRIKNRLNMVVGGEWGDDPGADSEGVDIVVFRVADIQGICVKRNDLTIRNVKKSKIINRLISKDSLIIEKSGGGENQPVGRVAYPGSLDFKAICSNFMAKVECGVTIYPNYLNYSIYSLYCCGLNQSSIKQTTGIQNLDTIAYLSTKVAFPKRAEQKRISDYLDEKCGEMQAIQENLNKQIEVLYSYRKSLIHECVTGKRRITEEDLKELLNV